MIATGSDIQTARSRRRRPDADATPDPSTGWLHLCNGLDPVRDGGMVPSILGMTEALGRLKGSLAIVTPTPSRIDRAMLGRGVNLSGPEINFEEAVRRAEVVHIHGLWQVQTRRGAPAARSARVPYVVAAHGMAEPWALRHKRLKKQVYLAFVEANNLRRAACLHALSRPEIGHLRAIAPKTPVCYVPNGVDLDPFDGLPERSVLEDEHPELKGKLVLLFFGRVHVKKGLDLLAGALSETARDHPDLHLLVAGNDDGAWEPFRARLIELGMHGRTTYLGHVAGERARRVWAAADAFILPSYSEGFSMAILEALACRLPCLITTACHFPELASCGGGIVVTPDAGGVTRGLRDLLDRSPAELAELGQNGRRLVEEHYTWDRQGARLAAVYEWLLGGGPPPEAVGCAGDGVPP
jgi:glycosyltransferase involved in cell wall biosynthesis